MTDSLAVSLSRWRVFFFGFTSLSFCIYGAAASRLPVRTALTYICPVIPWPPLQHGALLSHGFFTFPSFRLISPFLSSTNSTIGWAGLLDCPVSNAALRSQSASLREPGRFGNVCQCATSTEETLWYVLCNHHSV